MHSDCIFIIKETGAHSSFPVSSKDFFKKNFLSEHSRTSASDFIFDTFMKEIHERLLFTFSYRKSKTKQKSRVALKLVNPKFAMQ